MKMLYSRAIECCALCPDLEILPGGDPDRDWREGELVS